MVAIAFAGTPDFAVPTLAALARADYEISAVLTQPDRPAGRGQMPRPSPVKREAEALGLTVHTPQRLDEARLLASLGPRPSVLVVVAYGLILPRFMLDWPGRGAVNVHASLLPRWRGAAPIQRVIEAGDALTGVSIMQMDEGLDTGPVFVHKTVSISDDETGGSLHDTLADLGAAALIEVLPGILSGSIRAQPQTGEPCYAAKVSKSEGRLDWRRDAAALERQIRAFDPWPGTEGTLSDGRRLRIWRARVLGRPGAVTDRPGSIVSASTSGLDVSTGDGILRILEIQAPSARRMTVAAWLAAHSLAGAAFVA